MKIRIFVFSLSLLSTILAQNSGIHGNIQIQGVKSFFGTSDNFDQLFGRANLKWAFEEDTTFSSLIHVRAYPAGFGFEPLLGASFMPDDTSRQLLPTIPTRQSSSLDQPTIQIYQAWIRYKFPDFDLRLGRMITEDTRSLHFGNYLDFPAGGTFTLSRAGVHNALEGSKVFGPFNTRAHIGISDFMGNKGFLRVYETLKPAPSTAFSLGYRVNMFDLVHSTLNDSAETEITHRAVFAFEYLKTGSLGDWLFNYELGWRHTTNIDEMPFPEMLSINFTPSESFRKTLIEKLLIIDLVPDQLRAECEYLYNRKVHLNTYRGIDMDFLWNFYAEKTWLKRMRFQGGIFAAPTVKHPGNTGVGVRFTSEIN